MSASLVGSEMCIRDSLALGGARRGLPLAHQVLQDVGLAVLLLPQPAEACLLYTSDAADDM
eukprot:11104965-Alexandrium_andersonii.AAC.1